MSMTKTAWMFCIAAGLAGFAFNQTIPVPSAPQASERPQAVAVLPITFEEIQDSYDRVQDYKCLFSKTEYIDKKMARETMDLYFLKPFNVKMVWIQPKKGQKVVYREGQNNNKLRARKGGFLGFVAVNLDPLSGRAMDDNRHPITQVGIGYLLRRTMGDIGKGQVEIKNLGDAEVEGRTCHHVEIISQGPRDFHYGLRTELWIDKDLRLPIQAKNFDYDNRWIETYTYARLQLNVGLKDGDFEN